MLRLKSRRISEENELKILSTVMPMIPESRRHLAIDGGANIGHWSVKLAKYFKAVMAFEPVNDTFDNLVKRILMDRQVQLSKGEPFGDVYPRCLALMDRPCTVHMTQPLKRHASTAYFAHTKPEEGQDTVEGITIDSMQIGALDSGMPSNSLGLLKLDLEGAELRALHGAVETIKRCRPLIVVEIIGKQLDRYGDKAKDVDQFLTNLGYKLAHTQQPNHVYRYDQSLSK